MVRPDRALPTPPTAAGVAGPAAVRRRAECRWVRPGRLVAVDERYPALLTRSAAAARASAVASPRARVGLAQRVEQTFDPCHARPVAGGMNRRDSVRTDPGLRGYVSRPRRRHCWVSGQGGAEWPGLVLEWRRHGHTWHARVVYVPDHDIAVETWVEAALVRPA